MPPQGDRSPRSGVAAFHELWLGEARIDDLPARSDLFTTVDPYNDLPERRLFLKALALPCAAACALALTKNGFSLPIGTWDTAGENDSPYRVEARCYDKLPDKMVRCKLCPR